MARHAAMTTASPAADSQASLWWTAFALAAASFATTLTLPYIGEEGIYTIASMEMKLRGEYILNTLYGTNHGQPPLLNWLIIPLADLIGWQHVLVASRFVTACATIGSGLVLAWLVAGLTRDARFAAFAALVYLTSDALIYHGWLAYTYPTLAFFAFSAIACLWIASVRQSVLLAWLANAALCCAALTKGASAYGFYAAAVIVLFCQRDLRRFLLRPDVLAPHLLGALLYLVWHRYLIGSAAQQNMDLRALVEKLHGFDARNYLNQLWAFPLETLLRFAPASLLVAYAWLRRRRSDASQRQANATVSIAAWITFLGWLPYWLWPDTGTRYVMPLYPLAAFVIADALWRQNVMTMRTISRWLFATIAFKYVAALWIFPAYLREHRGDYAAAATEIEALTAGSALYANDVSATGLSVVANIDARRFPGATVRWPPPQWESGFLLSNAEDDAAGNVVRKFALGGKVLYLLCRGVACARRATR
jgi:4-amino-4-deoxy-L-arabinose transferase-like glycosyltransferase